ncbi:hypothetical protein C8J56DRAFT_179324 [Mycena floridula]|nr:hypothetical protein C8J56DRAFT_179324 [Mycena floridula]
MMQKAASFLCWPKSSLFLVHPSTAYRGVMVVEFPVQGFFSDNRQFLRSLDSTDVRPRASCSITVRTWTMVSLDFAEMQSSDVAHIFLLQSDSRFTAPRNLS